MTASDVSRERVSIAPAPVHGDGDAIGAAWRALATVLDPELHLDVVSLGLVYDIIIVVDRLVVTMTLTTPGCPASESLIEMTRAAIARVVGPSLEVEVRIVWDPPWSPEMIDPNAAAALGFRIRR